MAWRGPLIATGLVGLVLLGGLALAIFDGGPAGAKESRAFPPEDLALPDFGRRAWARCQGCHGADGAGLPGYAPDMRQSALLRGDGRALAAFVLRGSLRGPVYNNQMPGFSAWSDDELAALLTWARGAWAPAAPALRPADIASARAQGKP